MIVKTQDTYWGYGFPSPGGDSLDWKITDSGQYSMISAPSNGSNVSDADGREAVHFYPLRDDHPHQCYVFEFVGDIPNPGGDKAKMDIVFLQDATVSQQPYINAVRKEILDIANQLVNDTSFITQPNAFTSDVKTLQSQLNAVVASGGGDGPEAQCDALDAALNSAWRDDATKTVILITDSPPHGVDSKAHDGFPDGCPLQKDPIRTVKRFAQNDITLSVIKCEPTLSTDYANALDFYKGLVDLTGGNFIPLAPNTDPKHMRTAITGLAAQAHDSTQLASKYRSHIQDRANAGHPINNIVTDLHGELQTLGVQHHEVKSTNTVYLSNAQGDTNARIWAEAADVKDGKARVVPVTGPRIIAGTANPDAFHVTLKKEAITSDHVDKIVKRVLNTTTSVPKPTPKSDEGTSQLVNSILAKAHKRT